MKFFPSSSQVGLGEVFQSSKVEFVNGIETTKRTVHAVYYDAASRAYFVVEQSTWRSDIGEGWSHVLRDPESYRQVHLEHWGKVSTKIATHGAQSIESPTRRRISEAATLQRPQILLRKDGSTTHAAPESCLESRLQERLGNRVRNLHVQWGPEGFVLQGRAATYYAKQLAQETAMDLAGVPMAANQIEVG